MTTQETVALTRDPQADAWADARDQVVDDVEAGVVDADTWGDDVPDGEVVRVLAEAYTGTLEIDASKLGDVAVDSDSDTVSIGRDA